MKKAIYLIFILLTQATFAQNKNQSISQIILQKDSLFWQGYNTCNYNLMGQFMDKKVEFYHDKGGLMVGSDKVMEATRKNICGNPKTKVRREALAETIRVFPLEENGKIYGAVLSGDHYFYQNDIRTGIAKFTHTWLLKNGEWQMHRILSYDHHEAKETEKTKEADLAELFLNQYIGTYNSPQFGDVEIKQNGKNLLLINTGQTMELYAKDAQTFYIKGRDLQFKFEKGVKIEVIENGQKVDEVKLKK